MTTIWKYPLRITDTQKILLPVNAKILSVGVQDDEQVCMWAVVEPNVLNKKERIIRMYGTGHQVDLGPTEALFIGTVQLFKTSLVYHVFEEIER